MIATYRLQLHTGFDFAAARRVVPYLVSLGVSHLYLSPVWQARPGSAHGYDVADHNRINPELGGEDGFRALLVAARDAGLGLILDWVPNHAGVGADNPYWQDVLAHGESSPWAGYFDIDWRPLKPELRGKLLLPFLGAHYGETLDRAELIPVLEEGRLRLAYHQHRFALAPRTWPLALEGLLDRAEGALHTAFERVLSALQAVLPENRESAEELAGRFGELVLDEVARRLVEQRLAEWAQPGSAPALHRLLEAQTWRLAWWKVAGHEINYRRFFDIGELVALRVDDPKVFAATHRLLGALLADRGVDGVRVDHVDGLLDPGAYLQRLNRLTGRGPGRAGIWVEKILTRGETIPEEWPVQGTTGYEFMNDVMGVLLNREGEVPLTRVYRRFLGEVVPYKDELHRSKLAVMESSLTGELDRLAYLLDRISEADYHTRDYTLESIRDALRQLIASFPRYRTYLPADPEGAGEVIRAALEDARRRNPAPEHSVYEYVAGIVLSAHHAGLPAAVREWVERFQQYTAPVQAKGAEDTAFYRYLRLAALNEVGGEPDHFGVEPQAFHARCRFRAYRYPRNLLASATHDHKRGEDLRMRSIVLAEVPGAWRRTLGLLSRRGARYRRPGAWPAPARADEYLCHQTLAALWPVDGDPGPDLAERLDAYLLKAAREAKLQTSWLNPNAEYEDALSAFARGLAADARVPGIISPLARVLARFGMVNSLAQLVLKLTTPGVPDFYQGSEAWELSLVDPDNRRPVDFAAANRNLEGLAPLLGEPDPARVAELLQGWPDGRLKLFVTARLLALRRALPAVFAGGYAALEAEGERAGHALAFARQGEGADLIVAVTRLPATLGEGERIPLGRDWGDTRLVLPAGLQGKHWRDRLTGNELAGGEHLELAGAMSVLPVACLERLG
jgi:(1->4)-alpha-D-glucan 1-alpha-D-glucosylmutase